MKKLFILLTAAMMAAGMMAQDVIYRVNYDTINAKVLTVTTAEITYKLADYEDGPLFTLPTYDIAAIRFANGVFQYFSAPQDELAAQPIDEQPIDEQPASLPLICEGNTYYYNGQAMDQGDMLEWYARQNCQAAYEQFSSARKMTIAGWVFLGIGAAMEVGAGVCAATYLWQRYEAGESSQSSSANRLTTWQRNPNYTPNPLRSAAIGLTVSALAFEAACVPLLVVGYHKMHSSVDVYNEECVTAQSRPYWTLQASANGLGLALNF